MSIVTGMNSETIKRGRLELEDSLSTRPVERVRVVGGGRPKVEKKNQNPNRLRFEQEEKLLIRA